MVVVVVVVVIGHLLLTVAQVPGLKGVKSCDISVPKKDPFWS